jgi:hypothetical protein
VTIDQGMEQRGLPASTITPHPGGQRQTDGDGHVPVSESRAACTRTCRALVYCGGICPALPQAARQQFAAFVENGIGG